MNVTNQLNVLGTTFYNTRLESDFNKFVNFSRPLYKSFCYQYTKNTTQIDDVLSSFYIKIYYKIDKYNDQFAFSTWSYTILKNELFHVFKMQKKSFKYFVSMDEEIFNEQAPLEDTIDERIFRLIALIELLPEHYRTIIKNKYFDSLTTEEMLLMYDVNDQILKNNMHHAYASLKQLFKDPKKYKAPIRTIVGNRLADGITKYKINNDNG